jgi:hypothetical protein
MGQVIALSNPGRSFRVRSVGQSCSKLAQMARVLLWDIGQDVSYTDKKCNFGQGSPH